MKGEFFKLFHPLLLPCLIIIFSFQSCSGFKSFSEKAFSSSVATGQTSIACYDGFRPAQVPLRLISNSEYDNIILDIFNVTDSPSTAAKFDVYAAGRSGYFNTSVTSDAGAPAISNIMVGKYWSAAGAIADNVISNKSASGSAYSNLASCAVGTNSVADSCYNTIIRNLTLKVWRRPVVESGSNSEFTRLKSIFKAGSNFDIGFHDFIKTLLINPNFLVVAFKPSTILPAAQVYELDNFQLASRLSFFLWQSSPDDLLLSLASAGTLKNNLRMQIQRMLKDPKAKRLAAVLTKEWITSDKVTTLTATGIDSGTLNGMATETRLLMEDIIMNDASFLNSIAADYSFLNQAMADYYGVAFSGASADQFYKTSLTSSPRRGAFNQAAFLISTAAATDKTHPVIRGKNMARKVACVDVAQPPANMDTSTQGTVPTDATPKEMLAIHTQNAVCNSCHGILDPYGLPLETYDQFGKWRTTYVNINNRTVDSSGQLPTGEQFANTGQFMSVLENSNTVRSCLVRNLMALSLARDVTATEDLCNASQISEVSMTKVSKFSDLVFNLVSTRQFQMQTMESQ